LIEKESAELERRAEKIRELSGETPNHIKL